MRVTIIFLILMLPGMVSAGELHFILNGKAIHLDRDKNYNEKNWGLGFEYDFDHDDKWIPLITGSSFKDSNKQTSNYLGGGIKRRFLFSSDKDGMHLDLGIVGFMMTRHDYKNNDPFPGALPFVSLGNDFLAVNATYIPKISPKHASLFYFQVMFKIAEF